MSNKIKIYLDDVRTPLEDIENDNEILTNL